MTITRYGTVDVDGLPVISQAVVHGGIVHLLGVTGEPGADVGTQTRQVLRRIDALLAAAGTDRSQLLTATVWLADMALFAEHNREWNAWVDRTNPPVRACVGAELWRDGLLVEVMATAALP